ncbi:MAG: type I-U CRISPR-associated protein Csb2, partial [Myxococcota bacterium]
MISIDVQLLTGRYVAARYDDRATAEWPPEPARLFSAFVAALHEHPDIEDRARRALAWLEALPPPQIVASHAAHRTVPNVFVPVNDTQVAGGWEKAFDKLEAAERDLARAPDAKSATKAETKVNKARSALAKAVKKATADDGKRSKEALGSAAALLPERRERQPRTFPTVRPDDPTVSFVWPEAEPDVHVKQALEALMSRVVRLGHSTSLVSCRVGDGSLAAARPEDTWVPDPRGEASLRVVTE